MNARPLPAKVFLKPRKHRGHVTSRGTVWRHPTVFFHGPWACVIPRDHLDVLVLRTHEARTRARTSRRNGTTKTAGQHLKVPTATEDALPRIEGIGDAHGRRRLRHQLHETHRPNA